MSITTIFAAQASLVYSQVLATLGLTGATLGAKFIFLGALAVCTVVAVAIAASIIYFSVKGIINGITALKTWLQSGKSKVPNKKVPNKKASSKDETVKKSVPPTAPTGPNKSVKKPEPENSDLTYLKQMDEFLRTIIADVENFNSQCDPGKVIDCKVEVKLQKDIQKMISSKEERTPENVANIKKQQAKIVALIKDRLGKKTIDEDTANKELDVIKKAEKTEETPKVKKPEEPAQPEKTKGQLPDVESDEEDCDEGDSNEGDGPDEGDEHEGNVDSDKEQEDLEANKKAAEEIKKAEEACKNAEFEAIMKNKKELDEFLARSEAEEAEKSKKEAQSQEEVVDLNSPKKPMLANHRHNQTQKHFVSSEEEAALATQEKQLEEYYKVLAQKVEPGLIEKECAKAPKGYIAYYQKQKNGQSKFVATKREKFFKCFDKLLKKAQNELEYVVKPEVVLPPVKDEVVAETPKPVVFHLHLTKKDANMTKEQWKKYRKANGAEIDAERAKRASATKG